MLCPRKAQAVHRVLAAAASCPPRVRLFKVRRSTGDPPFDTEPEVVRPDNPTSLPVSYAPNDLMAIGVPIRLKSGCHTLRTCRSLGLPKLVMGWI